MTACRSTARRQRVLALGDRVDGNEIYQAGAFGCERATFTGELWHTGLELDPAAVFPVVQERIE